MAKPLLLRSALILCISSWCASSAAGFILVGRNGVGRGESLKGSGIAEKDTTDNPAEKSLYFGGSSSGGSSSSKDAANSNASGADGKIAKCRFTAGPNDLNDDEQLPSFYIPSKDKELYESGVRELLSQVTDEKADPKNNKAKAPGAPVITLECEDVNQALSGINCRLCMYNEISKDKKHLRQGQVLDVSLDSCIFGKFGNNSMNVLKDGHDNFITDYHPICYPPSTSASNNSNSSGGRSRFRKAVESGNKYEAQRELEDIVSMVRKVLLNAFNGYTGGEEDVSAVNKMYALPDQIVVTHAEIDVPEIENSNLRVGDGESYYVELNNDILSDLLGGSGEGIPIINSNYVDMNAQNLDYNGNGVGANVGDNAILEGYSDQDENNFYTEDASNGYEGGDAAADANTENSNNGLYNTIQNIDEPNGIYLLDNSAVLSGRELLDFTDSASA